MQRLTIDVEDYFSIVARDMLGVDVPVSQAVDTQVGVVLALLDELEVTTTCFVVGRLAEERPHIVRAIADRGHEIASHSHCHLLMQQHTPHTFREDVRSSIRTLEDITGNRVRGFRAPAFSLRQREAWAFEILREEGISYDSSVRYTWPFPGADQRLIDAANEQGIREYPGFALGWRRYQVPLAGGGGLRFFPSFTARWALKKASEAGVFTPVYLHPYDLMVDEEIPAWPKSSVANRIRLLWFNWIQRRGRAGVRDQLRQLLIDEGGRTSADASHPRQRENMTMDSAG